MRFVEVHKQAPTKFTEEQIELFERWFSVELEDAIGSRSALEASWRDSLRMYEGVPKNPSRNFPVENAPNLEVTIGAIACDALFAQTIDTIFALTPFLTVRPVPKKSDDDETVKNAKAVERFVNWIAQNECGTRSAGEEHILDTIQLGTGIYYIPWVERRKKARAFSVKAAHPVIKCHPVEDFFVPGGSYGDVQSIPWLSLRFWYSSTELNEDARRNGWSLGKAGERVTQAGSKDWVRTRRETLSRSVEGSARRGDLFEIHKVWCYFDIDEDGIDEDLFVTFDRTAKKVLKIDYNPYDHRPIEAASYQRRAHVFYGLGVLDMLRPYEEGITDFYNYWVLNALISNTKNFVSRTGTLPSNHVIWPGKNTEVDGDPREIQVFDLGRLDSSLATALATTVSFAERRVGLNEMNITRPSQVLGSRTPGITAISMLQQINRRFTPAFDNMRLALAAAVRQCLYRYQERLMAGNADVMKHITDVLGVDDGYRAISVLRDTAFDESIAIELTAVSATINKETDRQNSIMLMNVLSQYYQRTLELVMVAANPQVPNEVRSVARKIADAAGEVIERTIRTFDQVRDPEAFIVRVETEIDQMVGLPQQDLAMLTGLQTLMQGIPAQAPTQSPGTGEAA